LKRICIEKLLNKSTIGIGHDKEKLAKKWNVDSEKILLHPFHIFPSKRVSRGSEKDFFTSKEGKI
jgi:hypothetical protein